MKKIYLDTNIYLDYLEDRKDRLRPLGEFAFNIIKRAIDCEFMVIISDFVIQELEKRLNQEKINEILAMLNKKLIKIERTGEDIERAVNNKVHFEDALHATLAIRADADYFVTRNITNFSAFRDRLKIILPESL